MTKNPNTCEHGYRIEYGMCPHPGCIAHSDDVGEGQRVFRALQFSIDTYYGR
jgi:hypothetical protein